MLHKSIQLALLVACLSACGGSQPSATAGGGRIGSEGLGGRDRSCDLAPFPSLQWTQCEAANFARILEDPTEEMNPLFQQRALAQEAANEQAFLQRALGADKLGFRFRSARDFPDRSGRRHHCEDIRAGCSP